MKISKTRVFSFVFCYAFALGLFSECVNAEGGDVSFEDEIEPILKQHCIDCHGPDEQESGLRLDRLANLLAGGDSGEPAITAGDPSGSYLIKLVRHQEPGKEMPPDDALSEDQIRRIEAWIASGAKTPKRYGPAKQTADLSHWAFRPIQRFDATCLDEFISRKLHDRGLRLSKQADRSVLIRRLYLIMLGIPPTPEQVRRFVSDDRVAAWSDLVDRVLASPHYGERWATYWLDLVRFGETHGFEMNRERRNAWHYRDWVIQSLNEDKPYDQFVREQLVGDALGSAVGTGFLVAGPYDQVKGQDPLLGLQQRMNELDDMINTTGTAFLALTTGCARCHNHKFDPISQRDYYAMQAVFAGVQHGDRSLPLSAEAKSQIKKLDHAIKQRLVQLTKFASRKRAPVNAKRNVEEFAPRRFRFVRFTIQQSSGGEACLDELEVYSGDQNVALASHHARASSSSNFEHPKHKLIHINDGQHGNDRSWIVGSQDGGWVQIEFPEPVLIDRIVWSRDRTGQFNDRLPIEYHIEASLEPDRWQQLASSADRQSRGAIKDRYEFQGYPDTEVAKGKRWLHELQQLQKQKQDWERSSVVYAGTFAQPGPTHRLYRGEPNARREEVGPNTIEVFGTLDLPKDAPEQLRRQALADWIASDENPLTARVIVNRIWQFHFGSAIVNTPSDFGKNGSKPSHPELLDYLAAELMNNDWSLKHVHRLVLNSKTWQQSNKPKQQALRIDAGARFLWRFPPRRLEAEAIRDSMLAASGALDLSRMGGPGFSPFEVEMENVRHYHAKTSYGPQDWRRMIYMTKVRQEREHVFGAFDCPDASMVVPKRSGSTTPLQALNLLNSNFVMQQAELLAARLEKEHAHVADQVRRAWQLCFQREPTEDELADSQAFIAQEGLRQFSRALFNANEFVFIP